MPTRDDAVQLLEEWVENENLRKHMYAVEAAVRSYAREQGADEDLWGLAGLLHDLDWEKYPDEHPLKAVDALKELGYPEEITGLVTATALVRPNLIDDLKPKSVKKKMKDATFARGVDREDVRRGAELIGADLTEHIQKVIDAMRGIADQLELTRD